MTVLVKFDKNWADELDVSGFKLYDSMDAWLVEQGNLEELEYSFGTNEGWEEGEIDETDFQTSEITSEDAAVLIKFFGKTWGHFPFGDY